MFGWKRGVLGGLIIIIFVYLSGCELSSVKTKGLTFTGDWEKIERGEIYINPLWMKECTSTEKRVNLEDLLKVDSVFKEIKSSKQAKLLSQSSNQQRLVLEMVVPLMQMISQKKTKEISSSSTKTTNADATTLDTTDSLTEGEETDYKSTETPQTDIQTLINALGDLGGEPDAPFDEVVYATCNSVLAGQTIQNVYDYGNMPATYSVYVIPAVVAFDPARITSENYIAEAELTLNPEQSRNAPKATDLRLIAVAPFGFSRLVDETLTDLRSIGGKLGLGAQLGEVLATAKLENLAEKLDQLTHAVRMPNFSVMITGDNKVKFYYMGYEGIREKSKLYKSKFHVEIIALSKKQDSTGKQPWAQKHQLDYKYSWYYLPKAEMEFQSSWDPRFYGTDNACRACKTAAECPTEDDCKKSEICTVRYASEAERLFCKIPVYHEADGLKQKITISDTKFIEPLKCVQIVGKNLTDDNLIIKIYSDKGTAIATSHAWRSTDTCLMYQIRNDVSLTGIEKLIVEACLAKSGPLAVMPVIRRGAPHSPPRPLQDYVLRTITLEKKDKTGGAGGNGKPTAQSQQESLDNLEIPEGTVEINAVFSMNQITLEAKWEANEAKVPVILVNDQVMTLVSSKKPEDTKTTNKQGETTVKYTMSVVMTGPISVGNRNLGNTKQFYLTMATKAKGGKVLYTGVHTANW